VIYVTDFTIISFCVYNSKSIYIHFDIFYIQSYSSKFKFVYATHIFRIYCKFISECLILTPSLFARRQYDFPKV